MSKPLPKDTSRPQFRVGRKLGRTLYLAGINPDDDPVVGMMDSPELAAYIVEAVADRDRLLGILSQTIQEIGDEGYAAWSSRLHQEVHGD